ncbi:hypothetical protein [Endozoicomonas sp. 8E]|uniref:hypothetical protein n=1 Tax=Endozoicomonas sp. 8E TaxID=3035692 RepID=UPI00293909BD|nr:hypothetical protein [Endozoicomonas sp. 8E]WOG28862.1 hypothetical protein P6910_04150 [Endozoicomonas sp. 8E]
MGTSCWSFATPSFAGMTTSEHGDELLEFCDTLLRGNDDLRAWERVVGLLRQPPSRE